MWKFFYYYTRLYKLDEYGTIIRCEYNDTRVLKYNNKEVISNRTNKEKKLKPYKDEDDYLNIDLKCNGKHRTYKIHHLVYIVFNENITRLNNDVTIGYSFKNKQYLQINHIDGNKQNNYYLNLEKVTLQDNIKHAVYTKIHNSQTKALHINVYRNNEFICTIFKIKNLRIFLKEKLGFDPNPGTLSVKCRNHTPYYGYTFEYKV